MAYNGAGVNAKIDWLDMAGRRPEAGSCETASAPRCELRRLLPHERAPLGTRCSRAEESGCPCARDHCLQQWHAAHNLATPSVAAFNFAPRNLRRLKRREQHGRDDHTSDDGHKQIAAERGSVGHRATTYGTIKSCQSRPARRAVPSRERQHRPRVQPPQPQSDAR